MTGFDCYPCGRYFSQYSHYEDHLIHSFRHHYCKPCQRDFVSEEAKQAHLDHSEQHMICTWCQTIVGNLRTHYQLNHDQCSECGKWTADRTALHLHYSLVHSHIYCIPCQRLFNQPSNLKAHKMSATHTVKKEVCPHPECRSAFVSRSALIAHLEAGTCPSGFALKAINTWFNHFDRYQLFVKRSLLHQPHRRFLVSNQYGDYPCPLCSKSFPYFEQLKQHLKSPKHQNNGQEPYTCPSQQCGGPTFSCLSGLLQHRERGDCERGYGYELMEVLTKLFNVVAGR